MRVVLSVMPLTISPYAYKVCIFVLSLNSNFAEMCSEQTSYLWSIVQSGFEHLASGGDKGSTLVKKTGKSPSVGLQLLKHLKGWFLPCHCRLYTALLHQCRR